MELAGDLIVAPPWPSPFGLATDERAAQLLGRREAWPANDHVVRLGRLRDSIRVVVLGRHRMN